MGESISLLTAFIAGVVSFFSPCVLPLVPGYISFISGVSVQDLREGVVESRAVMVNTFAFVIGFSIVFIAFGVGASAIGQLVSSNHLWLQQVGGVIVILFGLHLTGILRLSWLYKEKRFHGPTKARGPASASLLGLAFAAGWTPCIGPILGGILAFAATRQTMWQGVALLGAYSAGLGIPFLLTGLASDKVLKTFDGAKSWLRAVEATGGVLLIGIGLLIISDNFLLLSRYLSFLNRFAL